jgi:hypothetical protein
LEHLEHLGLPYELDDLLGGDERGPTVSFALDFVESDATIIAATGGRFDDYLKRETRRKDSVGVGASIYFRKKGANKSSFTSPPKAVKPKIYFAQLGLRAKLQGLTIIDMLRTANVPVLQSFDANHLSLQLAAAAHTWRLTPPYHGSARSARWHDNCPQYPQLLPKHNPRRRSPRFLRTLK